MCTFVAVLRGDQQVRNKLIDLLENMKVGWAPDSVETIGERFVKQLSKCSLVFRPSS